MKRPKISEAFHLHHHNNTGDLVTMHRWDLVTALQSSFPYIKASQKAQKESLLLSYSVNSNVYPGVNEMWHGRSSSVTTEQSC